MGRIRRGDYLVVDRVLVHGNDITRDGGLHSVDVHVRELNNMKEITIVLLILLLAVWAWSDTKKGGKP